MWAAALLILAVQEDYSNLKVGNTWTYKSKEGQEITWAVAGKEKKAGRDCFKVEIKTAVRTNVEWVDVNGEGEWLVAKDRYTFKPPYPRLKTGSKIGDKWEARTTVESEVESDAEQNCSYDVIGTEDVDVPAGHFSCLKINFTIKKGQGEVSGTHWRADGVGIVKIQLEPGGVFELVKYEGSSSTPAKEPNFYPLKNGQSWTYVTEAGDWTWTSKFVAAYKDGEEFDIVREVADKKYGMKVRAKSEGIQITAEQGKANEPPQWLFKYPLKEGTTWETRFAATDWNAEVGKSEEVEVPAGKYKCVAVNYTSKDGKSSFHLWLAADVGIVKSRNVSPEGTFEQKLKKIDVPK
jgi:hypothetical protein